MGGPAAARACSEVAEVSQPFFDDPLFGRVQVSGGVVQYGAEQEVEQRFNIREPGGKLLLSFVAELFWQPDLTKFSHSGIHRPSHSGAAQLGADRVPYEAVVGIEPKEQQNTQKNKVGNDSARNDRQDLGKVAG